MAARTLSRLFRQLCWTPPQSEALPDEQLLARFAGSRDEGAFEEMVRRHGPMVLGVCRRLLRHEQDAEDAFQATFLVLARRAASLQRRGALGNWLYGVARRTALAALRSAARRRAREARVARPDAQRPGERDDLPALLDGELAALPGKYRAVLVLLDLEGRTRQEAAGELGVPEGTVASRLARARGLLARRLARKGWALPGVILAAGGVETPLAGATVKAAMAFAGGSAAAGQVPARAAALARGVEGAMWWSKMQFLAVAGLALALLGGGLTRLLVASQAVTPDSPVLPKRADKPAAPAEEGRLREMLEGLERKSWEAWKRQDWEALKGTTAEDFVAITNDGGRLNRAELLKVLAGAKLKSYTLSKVRLTRLAADAAVLTYKAELEYAVPGGRGKESSWVSSAWARRGGKWLNVLYQETPVKK